MAMMRHSLSAQDESCIQFRHCPDWELNPGPLVGCSARYHWVRPIGLLDVAWGIPCYIFSTHYKYMYLFYNIILKKLLVHSNISRISTQCATWVCTTTTKPPLDNHCNSQRFLHSHTASILLHSKRGKYSVQNICHLSMPIQPKDVAKPCRKTCRKKSRTKSCRTIHQKIVSFLCTVQYIWSVWVCHSEYVSRIVLLCMTSMILVIHWLFILCCSVQYIVLDANECIWGRRSRMSCNILAVILVSVSIYNKLVDSCLN